MSGSWVMFALPRIRQGHIFPTVVDNEASGKANGLKLSECSFWGRDGVNYSMAAALLNVGSSIRRLLWGAWISPSVSGFQKPKVKKVNNRKSKNEKCLLFLNCRKSTYAPKLGVPSRCTKPRWSSWVEREKKHPGFAFEDFSTFRNTPIIT